MNVGGYGASRAGGGSLRIWKRYFRRALVYGADLFDKSAVAEQRIYPIQGDLSSPAFLVSLAERTGPLDIIIDDASHRCADVIAAFQALFPQLTHGGLYVIEDLETSYWEGYGGSSANLNDPGTSMGFLKTLADGLYQPGQSVAGLHFYHNLAFVEKGHVAERPLPIRVRQAPSYEDMAAVGLNPSRSAEPA